MSGIDERNPAWEELLWTLQRIAKALEKLAGIDEE
jgi:hypothetical protein